MSSKTNRTNPTNYIIEQALAMKIAGVLFWTKIFRILGMIGFEGTTTLYVIARNEATSA
jgi:hypothetical protein